MLQFEVGWIYKTNCPDEPVVRITSKDYARQTLDGKYYGPCNPGCTYDLIAYAEPEVIKPQADQQPQCPMIYRVKTIAELDCDIRLTVQGEEWFARFGGRECAEPSFNARGQVKEITIDGKQWPVVDTWISRTTLHSWHDNGGFLRTWCSRCDCDGEWDRSQFKYVEVAGRKNSITSNADDEAAEMPF